MFDLSAGESLSIICRIIEFTKRKSEQTHDKRNDEHLVNTCIQAELCKSQPSSQAETFYKEPGKHFDATEFAFSSPAAERERLGLLLRRVFADAIF